MTLRHLKVFIQVCNQKSITGAAKELFIAQPAVSQTIKELETHYNIKLFDRISRRLFLTEAGQKLFFFANGVLSMIDEMEQSILDISETGTIKIGASITVGTHYIPDYVERFKKEHPDVYINIYINSSKIIEQKILKNELDFAVIEGTVNSPIVDSQKIASDKLVVICCPNHPLLCSENLEADKIFSEPFLLREKGSGTRETFDRLSQSLGFNVAPIWESSGTYAIINGVAKGFGISVLPYRLVKRSLDEGVICKLNIQNIDLSRNYYIIKHKNKYLSALSGAFIDMIKKFHTTK